MSGNGHRKTTPSNEVIFPFLIIDSPLPTDPTNPINVYLQRLVGRLDAMSTKIKNFQSKLQQQNPEYASWKAKTREALQSESESDSDERLRERLQNEYKVMMKREWNMVGSGARSVLIADPNRFLDKAAEMAEKTENE
jgi:hypothetical protein